MNYVNNHKKIKKKWREKQQHQKMYLKSYFQIQNGDQFVSLSQEIRESLSVYNSLMTDLVEFSMTSINLLQEMPQQITEVKVK